MTTTKATPSKNMHRRSTDVSMLTFPIQFVIMLVTVGVTTAGSIWWSQAGLRSDVRDINTRMMATALIEETKAKLADERAAALKEAVENLKKEQRMLDLNLQTANQKLMELTLKSGAK